MHVLIILSVVYPLLVCVVSISIVGDESIQLCN